MRRFGLPIVPLIVGVILLPNAERQMRRALQLSDGHVSGLVNSTFSVVVYAPVGALLAFPLVRSAIRRRRRARECA
jgi:putative tricarboxylic transport membrane protein